MKKQPEPTHPGRPKICPRCRGRRIHAVHHTADDLHPWRCRGCGAIGWDRSGRVVGDGYEGAQRARKVTAS